MRFVRAAAILTLVLPSLGRTQVTRVATFENFTPGANFNPSFTDPLSGITFRDSTHSGGGFDVNYDATFFGGRNYLSSGAGPQGVLGAQFGFTGDLPSPVDRANLDVFYISDPRSNVILQGFNSVGSLVSQQAGPAGQIPEPFALQITSAQFDITTFRVTVSSGGAGYDNISYTIIPEPILVLLAALLMPLRGRRSI